MIDNSKDWYLVKYKQDENIILSNFVHRDAIDSLLKILQHNEERTILKFESIFYYVTSICFQPASSLSEYIPFM